MTTGTRTLSAVLGWACACTLSLVIQPVSAAEPLDVYELYAEAVSEPGVRTRILARFEIHETPNAGADKDGKDKNDEDNDGDAEAREARLVSIREFGAGQTLIFKADLDLRFPFRTDLQTTLDRLPTLAPVARLHGPAVLDTVMDFVRLTATPAAAARHMAGRDDEPSEDDAKTGKPKPLFNIIMDAIRDDEPKAAEPARDMPQIVTVNWSAPDAFLRRMTCHRRSAPGPDADAAAQTQPATDTKGANPAKQPRRGTTPKAAPKDPMTVYVRYEVPERPCTILAGHATGTSNIYTARQTGDTWTHRSGTETLQIDATLDPQTGSITTAYLQAHQTLSEWAGCTRYGALCQSPVPVRTERQVELVRMPNGHRRY